MKFTMFWNPKSNIAYQRAHPILFNACLRERQSCHRRRPPAVRCVGRRADSRANLSERRAASSGSPSLLFDHGAGSHFGKLSPTDLVLKQR